MSKDQGHEPKTKFSGPDIVDYLIPSDQHQLSRLDKNPAMYDFIKNLNEFVLENGEKINNVLSLLMLLITHKIYLIGEVKSGKSTLFGVMTLFVSLITNVTIETKFGFLIPTDEDNSIDIKQRVTDLLSNSVENFFALFNMDIDNSESDCRSSTIKETSFNIGSHSIDLFDTTGHKDRSVSEHQEILSKKSNGRLIIFTIAYNCIGKETAYSRFSSLIKTDLTNLKVLCIITQIPEDIKPFDYNLKCTSLKVDVKKISRSYGIPDEEFFIEAMKYSIHDVTINPNKFLNNVIGIFINLIALQSKDYYDIYTKLCKDKDNKSKTSPELAQIFSDAIVQLQSASESSSKQIAIKPTLVSKTRTFYFATNGNVFERLISIGSMLSIVGTKIEVTGLFSATSKTFSAFSIAPTQDRKGMLKQISVITPKSLNDNNNFLILFDEISFNIEDNVLYNTEFPVFDCKSNEVIGFGYFYKAN